MPSPSKSAAKPVSTIAAKTPVAAAAAVVTAEPVAAVPIAAKADKRVAASKSKLPAADKAAKVDKAKKPKLVRDSFTIPKAEYAVLDALKARALGAGVPAKKSELLRAGIKALADLNDAGLVAALGAVPAIKTGRPAKA